MGQNPFSHFLIVCIGTETNFPVVVVVVLPIFLLVVAVLVFIWRRLKRSGKVKHKHRSANNDEDDTGKCVYELFISDLPDNLIELFLRQLLCGHSVKEEKKQNKYTNLY